MRTPLKFNFVLLFLSLLGCSNKDEAAGESYLLNPDQLADYESSIDHRRIISEWNREFYHKGMITYRNACFSCHGNIEQPGSIPNSRQFWKEAFKNGSDPYSMYQTLTRGSGLMPPQVNLTPREKYEVINFIREEFLKEANPDQYFEVTEGYLASLPAGDTLGPDPTPYHPWADMDYGNYLIQTYELANSDDPPREISGGRSPLPNEDYRNVNFAYKGIAMRLDEGPGGVAKGKAFALFDHDLMRFTGFWTGEGFIDYESILLNDRHNIYPRTVGTIQVENPITPGWANPETGDFKDPRFVAVDGRPFGPLPKEWAHFKGLYTYEGKTILKYTIGDGQVLESYDLEAMDPAVISRTLAVEASSTPLTLRISPESSHVKLSSDYELQVKGGYHTLTIPANTVANLRIYMSAEPIGLTTEAPEDLNKYTNGGPRQNTQTVSAPIIPGETEEAYAVDVFTLPQDNPWNSRLRPTGIDFINGGKEALLCTIDGEVWRVEGISEKDGNTTWHRIATGMFQPLGIKYHKGVIYVGCRDQIVALRDLNGDGETDFYESFNNDHQVTEHFHEFAMGLQVDDAGNFYYAKSGRHARTALVPQHGTLIRVSPDGSNSEIIATGFRAANGVCLNPDGSFIVTDQEGYWNPMNRINWVTEGGFYGNMYGYGAPADSSDAAMIQPLSWIDMRYDRSPAELLWADSDRWGPLNGQLLNLSYGYGKIFSVMTQEVDGTRQGGMIELPVPQFPTGLMRARYNPLDGQFYGCGMSAWATNQMIQVGGFYRVRYTGNPLNLATSLAVTTNGVTLEFSDPLDAEAVLDTANYTINTWNLERTRRYGSKRYDERRLEITSIDISEDGKTVRLTLPDIQPVWCMEILYQLKSREGKEFEGAIQNTVYKLEINDLIE